MLADNQDPFRFKGGGEAGDVPLQQRMIEPVKPEALQAGVASCAMSPSWNQGHRFRCERHAGSQAFQERFLAGPEVEQRRGSQFFIRGQGGHLIGVAEGVLASQQTPSPVCRLQVHAERAITGDRHQRQIMAVREIEMNVVERRAEQGFAIFREIQRDEDGLDFQDLPEDFPQRAAAGAPMPGIFLEAETSRLLLFVGGQRKERVAIRHSRGIDHMDDHGSRNWRRRRHEARMPA